MPVSAADSGTMLYNGVELPKLPELTGLTQEQLGGYGISNFKYYVILQYGSDYELYIGAVEPYWGGDTKGVRWSSGAQLRYKIVGGVFSYYATYSGSLSLPNYIPLWTNFDLYDVSKSTLYLAASDPVEPNSPTPITGNMFFETVHPLDDSVSVVCAVSDLSETTPTFDLRYTLSSGGTEVRSGISEETFTGTDNQFFHLTLPSLTPETEYDLTISLYADGEDTGLSASTSFTTLASSGSGGGSDPDYSGQLNGIQQGIGEIQDSVDNVGSKVDDIQDTLTETKEEITSLPGKIASAILDGIKSLFVPSEEDLTEIKDKYESMLSEKLGFIWQAFDLLTTFVSDLQTSLESGEAYEFNFPGVKLPMQGEEFVLVPETAVSLDNGLMDVLRPVLGTVISMIAVIAFVNMAHDYVLAIISGVSAYQFERRKE